MNEKPSPSQEASFHGYNTAENEHRVYTPDVDDHPLRPPAAVHLPSLKNSEHLGNGLGRSQRPDSPQRNVRDPEKSSFDRQSMPSQPSYVCTHHPRTSAYPDDLCDDDDDDDEESGPKRHAVWILIYLSVLAPLLALPLSLYTLVTATMLLLLWPLRFCITQRPSSACFYRFLSPAPLFQLGLICSTYGQSTTNNLSTYSILTLVVVNVLSPVYAVAIAGAAWVAAVFWAYTAVLGNPDGKEERDDGREAVLSVRGWWERWLVQGLD